MGISQLYLKLRRQAGLYNFSRIVNPVYSLFTGGAKRPAFFDIDRTFPALRNIDRAYPEIRQELDALLLQQDAMPRYHDIDSNLISGSGRYQRDKRWNVFMLYCYGSLPSENRALCPRTCAALDKVPYLNQAFFSILDPGKSIPAHTGPTQAYIRYHLGLRVPLSNPPSIRVRTEHYTWKEGESVLFDDSLDHQIDNQSDGLRAVLIVDVMRPFPQPIFAFNLLFRKLGEWFYGPRLVAKAKKFQLRNPQSPSSAGSQTRKA